MTNKESVRAKNTFVIKKTILRIVLIAILITMVFPLVWTILSSLKTNQEYLLNIVIVLIVTIGMFVYLKFSKHGYEITVVGESQNTARYIGISVKKVIIRTMLISGALCGIAGLLLVAGTDHTISRDTVAGRGFTAIMVSWLAKFDPIFMILTAFLVAFLDKGAAEVSTQFGLNRSFSDIIMGIIIFFIIGSEFFLQYTVKFRRKEEA